MTTKLFFLIIALAAIIGQTASAQSGLQIDPAIQTAVDRFVQGADRRDVPTLESVLHPQFRTTVNQFMGGDDVTVLPRETYLSLVQQGQIGGEPRTVTYLHHAVHGHTAHVQVRMESSSLVFNNFLGLVQDKTGKWWLLSDAAMAKPRS